MDKEELLTKLRQLAKRKKKRILTNTDLRTEKKLRYYLYQHYDSIADALEDAGLKASKLAKRMRMSDEEKLRNLYELSKRIGRIPRHKDINKEGWYKIYDKFGGLKKAYEQALVKFGSPVRKKKIDKKLPEIICNKDIIIDEIRRVVDLLGREDITRNEFLENTQIVSTRDLESVFGGWSDAFLAAGYKPVKWHSISNEDLFKEYSRLLKLLGHYPLGVSGYKEINNNSIYRAGVYKKRFKGGLKGFAIQYLKWAKTNLKGEDRKVIKQKRAIGEEKTSVETPSIETSVSKSRFYYGNAAEYLVVSELLFRGYNAQKLPVDEGLDVFAVKDRRLYLLQVKHSQYKKPSESRPIKITISSLERNKGLNVFYVLVLSRKEPSKRDFLILPYSKIDELIKIGVLQQLDNAKHISFKVLHKTPQDAYISEYKDSSNVSRYLNAWDVLL